MISILSSFFSIIDFSPEPFFIWIPFFLLITFFIFYKKNYTSLIFILPIYLFILFINPSCEIKQKINKQEVRLFIDQSYSSKFVDYKLKKEIINTLQKKYNISNKHLYNFQSIPLEKQIFEKKSSQEIPNKTLFAFQKQIDVNEEDKKYFSIYLTDTSNTQLNFFEAKQKNNILSLPLKTEISGIFDLKIPENCYINEICIFSALVKNKTTLNKKITLQFNHKKIKTQPIPKNFTGWISFSYKFSSYYQPQNLSAQFIFNDNSPSSIKNMPFLISLKKGLPNGYVFFSKYNLLSWRLSYILQKNRSWNLKLVDKSQKKIKLNKDFYIQLLFQNQLLHKYNHLISTQKPVLFIWANGNNNYLLKNKYIKIIDNYYQNKNISVIIWNIPIKNKNIFFPVDRLETLIENFSENLKSTQTLFSGGYIETLKPFFLLKKDISQIDLVFNQKKISFYVQKNHSITLPFWGQYQYNNLIIETGCQKNELLDLYKYKKKYIRQENKKLKISTLIQSFDKQFKIYKKNTTSHYLKKINYSLGFHFTKNSSQVLIILSILLLFAILIYFWYFR